MSDFYEDTKSWFNSQEWFSTILPFDTVTDIYHDLGRVQITGTVTMPDGSTGLQQHLVDVDSFEDFARMVQSS